MALSIAALIKALKEREQSLYSLYIDVLDLDIADALLHEHLAIRHIVEQLKNLTPGPSARTCG